MLRTFVFLCLLFYAQACAGQTFLKPELYARLLHENVPIGFPIAVEFTFKNVDSKSIWITEGVFPFMSAWIHCAGSNVKPRPPKNLSIFESMINGSMSCKEVPSGAVRKYVQYIDPKWIVFGSGNAVIQYRAVSECLDEAQVKSRADGKRQYWVGELVVTVENRRISEDDVKKFYDCWDGTCDSAESIQEGLRYIEEPFVIPYVVRLARKNPHETYHAFKGLEKFASRDDARKALEDIAEEFNPEEKFLSYFGAEEAKENYSCDNLQNAFIVFRRTETRPSKAFISKQLQSKGERRVRIALEHLLKADWQRLIDANDVKKLMDNKDEYIREEAQKLMAKLPPPAPRVDF